MKPLITLLLVTALCLSGAVNAQQKPQLQIVVDGIDADAIACGLSQQATESISALALRNGGVQSAPSRTNPYLYIQLSVVRSTASCVAHLRIEINADSPAIGKIGGFKGKAAPEIILCSGGTMIGDTAANMSNRYAAALEQQIKRCLGKLEY